MSDLIANHVSVRVPGEHDAFLINAYGLLYEEITASSLLKIDHEGNVLAKPEFLERPRLRRQPRRLRHPLARSTWPSPRSPASSTPTPGRAWRSRPWNAACCPTPRPRCASPRSATTTSTAWCSTPPRARRWCKSLGDNNALILRNHGLLTTGATIPEAFNAMHRLELSLQDADRGDVLQHQADRSAGRRGRGDLHELPAEDRAGRSACSTGRRCCGSSTASIRASATDLDTPHSSVRAFAVVACGYWTAPGYRLGRLAADRPAWWCWASSMSASRSGSTSGTATSSTRWRSATSRSSSQLLWVLAAIVVSAGVGRRHPAPRQAPAADQLADLAVAHHGPALAAFGPPVPARPAGRGSRQSRRPHRRGHPRLDRVRRRVRPEHPPVRPAARHLPQRAVDPVGDAADQARSASSSTCRATWCGAPWPMR